jgi:hypothetical protein
LRLTFFEVEHIFVSSGLCKHKTDTIEEIGFKASDDKDDEWIKTVEQADPADHLFIRFSSLEFIRIKSSVARVEIERK